MSSSTLEPVVVLDLDGCLADDAWRLHIAEAYGWDAYHAVCRHDAPMNEWLLELHKHSKRVWFVTGRPERCRPATLAWIDQVLKENGLTKTPLGSSIKLLMRPNSDTETSSADLKPRLLEEAIPRAHDRCLIVYDDREDVLGGYRRRFPQAIVHRVTRPGEPAGRDASALLQEAAETFKERNATYKDNYRRIVPLVKALFPDGVPPGLIESNSWHLLELILVKLTRFTQSEFKHRDSIHDIMVYAAMIESEEFERDDDEQ